MPDDPQDGDVRIDNGKLQVYHDPPGEWWNEKSVHDQADVDTGDL